MNELPISSVTIHDPFWTPKLETNAQKAIFYQWDELEKSGCIDNFRIVAGEKEGFREGWFFADSDAYKWLDAAARIYACTQDDKLKALMDELIRLVGKVQLADGYINTYNQFHFPGQRWVNLQIEHELYCLGHLIEGAVSHFEATGQDSALKIAQKAADLLVKDFMGKPADKTEGHQEVEIALLKLGKATGRKEYLDLARHFIEIRGRVFPYAPLIYFQNESHEKRKAFVRAEREKYAAAHPEYATSKLPPDNPAKMPPNIRQRRNMEAMAGRYNQQHAPIRKQTEPVGHAVRYGYFQTAITMLHRLNGDSSLLPALQKSWERMVTRRMYVTGGLGALPDIEGFGNDYELDPEYAYNETCAALASLFWNWEMALALREARYSDLFEWQLYNAAAPGISANGHTYLYNNPLAVRGGITRQRWYSVPCCPSNLSRTWAHLGKYIYSVEGDALWIHQYIGNEAQPWPDSVIKVDSKLPFSGLAVIELNLPAAKTFTLNLRIPSWCAAPGKFNVKVNGEPLDLRLSTLDSLEPTAQGYDPRPSRFVPITREWNPGDRLELTFDMSIAIRKAHTKVKDHAGKVALTRGPLVYCLESTDNPGVDIFTVQFDPSSLRAEEDALFGGINILRAKATSGQTLTFIPYHLWANRGDSQMTVWVSPSVK
jgi:DUF1680 family protein